jgi:hypothetical protein
VLEGRPDGGPALSIGGAGVTVEGLEIRAAAGAIGIEARDCHRLTLRDVHIRGGARGLAVRGGDVSWTGGTVSGASDYGVWAQGTTIELRAVRFADHHGPALSLTEGQAKVVGCSLASSEYGILGFREELDVADSDFSGSRRDGVGLARCSGRLARNTFRGPFLEAAVSVIGTRPLRLEHNRIEQAGAAGIKLTNSTATLEGNVVSGTRSDHGGLEGDGLFLFDSRVASSGDVLRDDEGTGVSVLGGEATLKGCQIEHAGQAAAYVGEHGTLLLSHCVVRGGSIEVVAEPGSSLGTEGTRFELPDAGHGDGGG